MLRSKDDAVRLFSVISSEMTRGNRHETQEFSFKRDKKKKKFTMRVIKQQYRFAHRGCGVPIPKDIQCMTGHNLLQPAQAEPA